jgi:hypothetical protein
MMNRQDVDDNCNNTCSTGLHFCSLNYLGSFGSSGDPVVILKIDPKDVVSIPVDYNNTKGRCCKYEVVGLYTQPLTASVETAYSDDINDEYEEELDPQVEADWEEYEERLDDEEGLVSYNLMSDQVDYFTKLMSDEVDDMSYEVDSEIEKNYLEIIKMLKSNIYGLDGSVLVDEYNIYCKTRKLAREVKNLLAVKLNITLKLDRNPVITHPWILR